MVSLVYFIFLMCLIYWNGCWIFAAVDYHVPAYLPIVCILIGLVSLTAIVVPFLYSKHPRPVETANFDFQSSDTFDQPSGSRKKLQDWLKKVAAKWKGLQARRLSFLGPSNSTMNFELERIPIVNYRTYGTGSVDIITWKCARPKLYAYCVTCRKVAL